MSWSRSVFSSMVSEVGYDTDAGELIVTWANNGRRTAYKGVPEELAEQLSNSPSVGQMMNTEIKPYYGFRNL